MYKYEKELWDKGHEFVAGCDEVGRGPLAGPVVAAAVILNPDHNIEGLNDSKQLSEKKRNILYSMIKEHALTYAVTFIWPEEIDKINIYEASKKAMIESIKKLAIKPTHVLSDAMPINSIGIKTTPIIKGDSKSATIAAASILAKVERDNYMVDIAKKYPEYGFEKHKGYPTKQHLKALEQYGVLPIHRKTYKPVYDKLHQQVTLDI